MPSTRATSVLGKRSQRQDQSSVCEQLQTPEPTPECKRVRTSSTTLGDGNKENIPPFILNALNNENISPTTSARTARALRRSTAESMQCTPARPKPQTKRRASIFIHATPTTAISTLHISTPPPTPPTLPPLETRARTLLRATCNDIDELPGREKERQIIVDFVQSFLSNDEQAAQSLYISGSPGSGKTALVTSILRSFSEQLMDVKLITINCMALDDVDALWRRTLDELDTSKIKVVARSKKQSKGKEAAEAVVGALKTKCIVLLDELDHIAPTTQTFASLLTFPEASSGMLRVIGIANTHTLSTTSISTHSVRTLHFAPYTSAQLLQILQSRLAVLYDSERSSAAAKKFLPVTTLTLLTKKVASLTGDVRCLLEVLRGAIDLATAICTLNEGKALICSVTPAHILAALKAHTPNPTSTPSSSTGLSSFISNSEIVSKIGSLGLQARLVLLSILLASKRQEAGLMLSGSTSPSTSAKRSTSNNFSGKDIWIDTRQLHGYYSNMLTRGDSDICTPASRNEFIDLTAMLEGMGLVSIATITSSSPTKMSKNTFGRCSSFNSTKGSNRGATGDVRLGAGVWVEEVLRGLGIGNEDSADIQEEEARAIWNRECSRLAKEVKVLQAKSAKPQQPVVGFSNTVED